MASNKLRIYLKAYDYTLLDESAKRIAEAAKKKWSNCSRAYASTYKKSESIQF